MPKNKLTLAKRKNIFLLISMIILLGSGIYIYKINYGMKPNKYYAEKGEIDLRDWDMEENTYLDGEWEFYPDKLISPEEDFQNYGDIKKIVNVPGSWKSYLNEDGTTDGSGTYRLKIKVAKDQLYAIKTRTIRTSSKVFINDLQVITTGKPALDWEQYIPDSKYKIGFGNSKDRAIELILHVTSYNYRSGGIIKSIELGSSEAIINRDRVDRSIDTIIIGICLVLGLYFFLTYLSRGKETYLAYFSSTCLFMGLYLSTMNEQLLDLIFKYDFYSRLKIQLTAMILVTVCILRFVYYFFQKYINIKMTNILTISLLFYTLAILILHEVSLVPYFADFIQKPILFIILISYIYIFYVLLKVVTLKVASSEYIVVISTCLSAYWVTLITKILFEFDLGYLPAVLVFLMMITVAILMSNRQQLDYREVVSLTNKLIAFDSLKDKFISKASKEIRLPMDKISKLTRSLIEGEKGPLNEKQQADLFFINSEGRRLRRLAEDFLDASDFNMDNKDLKLEKIDPYKITDSLLNEMELMISKGKDISLVNKVPYNISKIYADRDKFTQILYNLIHNAIKFTDKGEIIIKAYESGDDIVFEIKDTGQGIDGKDLDRIYDVFFQKNYDSNPGKGLGIGLPIVKKLVEAHGGQISVDSIYGQGSTFKFNITKEDRVTSNSGHRQENQVYADHIDYETDKFLGQSEKYNILVIDNKGDSQEQILAGIGELHIHGLVASNGREALEIIEEQRIDLIIVDLILPDISGDNLCKLIREKYSILELPIILLTTSGRNIDLSSVLECGANDFIKKPVDGEELKSRIKSLLLMKESVQESLTKEFQYFYSQISPHFLYNTINTIMGLSYENVELSRKALENLSIYFRGKLDFYNDSSLIPLEDELDLVRAYLEIEEMRYGDKLEIGYDIEEDLDVLIPPLTLQPIVENAIRHGLSKKEDGKGKLKITVRDMEDRVNIIIEDNGIGISLEKQKELLEGDSQRIGFRNVVKKLKILKGASIKIESEEDRGTKIIISLRKVKVNESYSS